MSLVSWQTLQLLLPELILILAATAIYVGGAIVPARRGWTAAAVAGLALAGSVLAQQQTVEWLVARFYGPGPYQALFDGPLMLDPFAVTIRWLALLAGGGLVLMSAERGGRPDAPEVLGSLLLVVAGVMLVAVAGNLVFLFLGLELISIPTYVLLYLGRNDPRAQESAAKYFFLSVLSSAVLLYGFSFLYGVGGSLALDEIHAALSQTPHLSPLAVVALVLVFAGLAFRLAAVPFHFYAPDVYQGASHWGAGLLAVVPKIAGLAALLRVAMWTLPGLERQGWVLALAVSVVTMTLGNVLGLWQQHVRRLLAYSSIAHAGYLLIGVAVGFATAGAAAPPQATLDGSSAALFYLIVYSVATLGTFAALACAGGAAQPLETLDDLAGLARRRPAAAAAIALFLLSLAGLPPLAGFWGKFTLFAGALQVDDPGQRPWFIALAVIGVLNAAIAAGYYLRVIAAMYFRPPTRSAPAEGSLGAGLVSLAAVVLVVAIGVYPAPTIDQARTACQSGSQSFESRSTAAALSATTPQARPPVARAGRSEAPK